MLKLVKATDMDNTARSVCDEHRAIWEHTDRYWNAYANFECKTQRVAEPKRQGSIHYAKPNRPGPSSWLTQKANGGFIM